jgi:hypothetical protein
MKKSLILILGVLFSASLFGGCIDQYEREISITWCNTDVSFNSGSDLIIKVHGRENTITIDKDVSLESIEFGMGAVNNTIWIHGQPKTNETSTWDAHNCIVKGISAEYGNIIKYRGD